MPEPRRLRTKNVMVDIDTWDTLKRWSVDYRSTMTGLVRQLVEAERTRLQTPSIQKSKEVQ